MATHEKMTRRSLIVVGGTTVMGAAAVGLAACAATGPTVSGSPPVTEGPGLESGTELAKLSEIPVGASLGVTVDGVDVVLAQPQAGTVVAFSAICRHQGCVVAAAGSTFDCPCHGSQYEAATGAVLNGPASKPLIEISVTVSEGSVVVA